MKFLRPAVIDDGFWQLDLNNLERMVYFYLSSRCQRRWGVSERQMVMALRTNVKRLRYALMVIEAMHIVKRWRMPRPKCHEYLITLTTEPHYGIRPSHLKGSIQTPSMGSIQTPLRGPFDPHHGVHSDPPPTTTECKSKSLGDSTLLGIALIHAKKWHFGRRAMGVRGIITRRHQLILLEMMRSIVAHGTHTTERMDIILDAVGSYLGESRDVLSDDGKDYREKTLGRWLANWSDQLHRGMTYLEMKEQNVVKMKPDFNSSKASGL